MPRRNSYAILLCATKLPRKYRVSLNDRFLAVGPLAPLIAASSVKQNRWKGVNFIPSLGTTYCILYNTLDYNVRRVILFSWKMRDP